MGKLAEVIEARFGFRVAEEFAPKPFTLTTTPQLILRENPDRISWDIVNLGTVVGYLFHTPDVSSSKCYYLDSYGGVIGMSWEEDGELVGRAIWARSASATCVISVKSVMGVR